VPWLRYTYRSSWGPSCSSDSRARRAAWLGAASTSRYSRFRSVQGYCSGCSWRCLGSYCHATCL